jgi:hypothetical protein
MNDLSYNFEIQSQQSACFMNENEISELEDKIQ